MKHLPLAFSAISFVVIGFVGSVTAQAQSADPVRMVDALEGVFGSCASLRSS